MGIDDLSICRIWKISLNGEIYNLNVIELL